MKRQLPKNVRQIGNVSDSSKVYVEDYVDTFMNQLCDKADQSPVGAFLVGEVIREGEEHYIYVYGALRMKDSRIDDSVWKRACEQCKEYFGDAAILGWFLATPGQALEINHNITKMHQKYFPKDRSIFIMKDPETKEEKYFLQKFHDLMECSGHYIYYEKNVEMQNYMIASRKKNGVTPSEIVEDRAAKNFRNVIKERMEKNEQKSHSRFLYVASTFLVLVVFVIGVTMLNNYDKMQGVQETLDVLSNTVLNNRTEKDEPEDTDPQIITPETTDPETTDPETTDPEVTDPEVTAPETTDPEATDPEATVPETTDPEVAEPTNTDLPGNTGDTYIVQKGDTLATISEEKYGSVSYVDEICEMNGLEDGNLIFIGQKLLLP